MKVDLEANKSFQISFNNKVIQINYDKSFSEFQNQTVESLIQLVLDKLSQPESKKDINNYCLFCPCGNQLELTQLLSKNLCEHKYLEKDNKKILGTKYLLIEKKDEKLFDKIKENEQPLSKIDFDKLFSEKKEIKRKNKKKKCNNIDNNIIKKSFMLTEIFEKRIKEYMIKLERAEKILSSGFKLFYDENNFKKMISFEINPKKARAALRVSNNNLEEAILIATDNNSNFEGKEFLFYANDDLIDPNNYDEILKKETKNEFPFLNDEQVCKRIGEIQQIIMTKRFMKKENERAKNVYLDVDNSDEQGDEINDDDDDDEEQI